MNELEEKFKRLEAKLLARTKPNGEARPGYEQNVAQIRAEMVMVSERVAYLKEMNDGE